MRMKEPFVISLVLKFTEDSLTFHFGFGRSQKLTTHQLSLSLAVFTSQTV